MLYTLDTKKNHITQNKRVVSNLSITPMHSNRTLQIMATGFPELAPSLQEISSTPASNLQAALSQISEAGQKKIKSGLGAELPAWLALDRAGNAQSFGRSLAGLVRPLEASAPQAALGIYQWASTNLSDSPKWQQHFSQRLAVLEGRAGVLPRIPVLLDTFAQQATDPVMIGSFVVAGSVAGLVRTSASHYLTHHGAQAWMRSGMGRQVLAGLPAFGAEVPAFVGAGRILEWGRQGFDHRVLQAPLGPELVGAGMFLGSLKMAGFLTGQIMRNANPAGWGFRSVQGAGTVAGIYGGQRLEEQYLGHPTTDEAMRWVHALNTYIQLQVGGRIAHVLTGIGPAIPQPDSLSPVRIRNQNLSIDLWGGWELAGAGMAGSVSPAREVKGVSVEMGPQRVFSKMTLPPGSGATRTVPTKGTKELRPVQIQEGEGIGEVLFSIMGEGSGLMFSPESSVNGLQPWRRIQLRAQQMGIKIRFGKDAYSDPISRPGELDRIFRNHGEPILLFDQLLQILPDSVLRHSHLKVIRLRTEPDGGGFLSSYRDNHMYLFADAFEGSPREMVAGVLQALGKANAGRYFLRPEESKEFGKPAQKPAEQGDAAIHPIVREQMHRAHQTLVEQDALYGLNIGEGELVRMGFQSNSLAEFMADLHVAYVAAGPQLRGHIRSYQEGSAVREAWEFVYEEISQRLFKGNEYAYRGVHELAVEFDHVRMEGYEVTFESGNQKGGKLVYASESSQPPGFIGDRAFTVDAILPDGTIMMTNAAGKTLLAKGVGGLKHSFVAGDQVVLIARIAGGSPGRNPLRDRRKGFKKKPDLALRQNIPGLTRQRARELIAKFERGYVIDDLPSQGPTLMEPRPGTITYREISVLPERELQFYQQWARENEGKVPASPPPPPLAGEDGGARDAPEIRPALPPTVVQKRRSHPPVALPPPPPPVRRNSRDSFLRDLPDLPPVPPPRGATPSLPARRRGEPPPLQLQGEGSEPPENHHGNFARALLASYKAGLVPELPGRKTSAQLYLAALKRGSVGELPANPQFLQEKKSYFYEVVQVEGSGNRRRGKLVFPESQGPRREPNREDARNKRSYKVEMIDPKGELLLESTTGENIVVRGIRRKGRLPHPFAVGDTVILISPIAGGAPGKGEGRPKRMRRGTIAQRYREISGLSFAQAVFLEGQFKQGYAVEDVGEGQLMLVRLRKGTETYEDPRPATPTDLAFYNLWLHYGGKAPPKPLGPPPPLSEPPDGLPALPGFLGTFEGGFDLPAPPRRKPKRSPQFEMRLFIRRSAEALLDLHRSGLRKVSGVHVVEAERYLNLLRDPQGKEVPLEQIFMEGLRDYTYPISWVRDGNLIRGRLALASSLEVDGKLPAKYEARKCKVLRSNRVGQIELEYGGGKVQVVRGSVQVEDRVLKHPFARGDELILLP